MRSSRRRSGDVFGSVCGSVVSFTPASSVSAAAVATSQSKLPDPPRDEGVDAGCDGGADGGAGVGGFDAGAEVGVVATGESGPSGMDGVRWPLAGSVRRVFGADASDAEALGAADACGGGDAGAHSCAAVPSSDDGFDGADADAAAGDVAPGQCEMVAEPGCWLPPGLTCAAPRASGLHCALSSDTATVAWFGTEFVFQDELVAEASIGDPTSGRAEPGVGGRSELACVVPLSASGSGCCRFRWNHPRPPPCAIPVAPRHSAATRSRCDRLENPA